LKITSARGVQGNAFIHLSNEGFGKLYNKDLGKRQALLRLSEGKEKEPQTLSQYFFKLISKAMGLRFWNGFRIQERNSRPFSCLKNVRDYRWPSQTKI